MTWRDRAIRALVVAVPVAGGALGLALPDQPLLGGLAWLVWLAASLAGWGALVARAVRCPAGADLRLAWGAAGYLAVAGWLMAAGLLRAPVQLALLAVGVAGFAWDVARAERLPDPAALVRALRSRPALAIYALIIVIAAVDTLDAAVRIRTNVYDDDVAYTSLVQRLLQVGDLHEPFSFRRISALGGQTVVSALAAVRGTLSGPALADAGLFRLISLALVVGMARSRARTTTGGTVDHLLVGALLLVLVVLPDTSINTGTHWSGVALFLALYRTATLDESRGRWIALGLVAAAAASLRQNYLIVAGGFVLVCLLFTSGPGHRRRWLAAAGGAALGLVPYLVASWWTCGTPLYPLLLGNFNPDVHLTSEAMTWSGELAFFFKVVIEPTPIRVMLPLALVLYSVRDRRPGRPLIALAVAATVGFVTMVHGFTLSDSPNLWRYCFGFMTAWVVAAVIEPEHAPGDATPAPRVTAPAVARLIALVCLLVQLAIAGPSMARSYAHLGPDLDAALHPIDRDQPVRPAYRAAQAVVPPGATLAVLLDQPYLLDYRRNPIVNLDVPGYVSPGPGLPSFAGAEAVAAYFHERGIRYLAFVRPDRSRYFYRRQFWVLRALFDTELWRVMGAYLVDFIDTAGELSRTRVVLHDRDGLVVLDLEARR